MPSFSRAPLCNMLKLFLCVPSERDRLGGALTAAVTQRVPHTGVQLEPGMRKLLLQQTHSTT